MFPFLVEIHSPLVCNDVGVESLNPQCMPSGFKVFKFYIPHCLSSEHIQFPAL